MVMRLVLLAISALIITECLAKRRLCGESLYRHLIRVCTFGYETTPCFKSRFATVTTTKSFSGRTYAGIANQCCEEGCTVLDLRATCCFKLSCLMKCYPESRYEKRVKNATAIKIF